jgi:hypothetical protein
MIAGTDDAVILPQQFFARVFGDGAELVVGVGDFSPVMATMACSSKAAFRSPISLSEALNS